MSLWTGLFKERHKAKATSGGSLSYYPKHWRNHNNNNNQEIPMVSVTSIHGALNFSVTLAYRMCLLADLSSIKLMPQKSQIVPVILTDQCKPFLKLLMRLHGSTVTRLKRS